MCRQNPQVEALLLQLPLVLPPPPPLLQVRLCFDRMHNLYFCGMCNVSHHSV